MPQERRRGRRQSLRSARNSSEDRRAGPAGATGRNFTRRHGIQIKEWTSIEPKNWRQFSCTNMAVRRFSACPATAITARA